MLDDKGDFVPDWSQWDNEPEKFYYYFKAHYRPLLDKIADCPYQKIDFSDKEKQLLGHLRDDLTKIIL